MQTFLHLSKSNKSGFFAISIGVERLESLLQTLGKLFNFSVQQYSERLFVWLGIIYSSIFVSIQKDLNCIDAERNKVVPCYFTVFVLIGKSEKDSEIVFTQIVLV